MKCYSVHAAPRPFAVCVTRRAIAVCRTLRTVALRATAFTFAALTFAVALARPIAAQEKVDAATIERINAESKNNGKVMEIMSWMSDVIGPRLTWSPNEARAAKWAMDEMKSWGLVNVHQEKWEVPNALGWENQRFSLMVTAPAPFIVQAVPRAWSASSKGTVSGTAVRLVAGCLDEAKQNYAGRLKNAFIMASAGADRSVNTFTATASRLTDSTLTAMAAIQPDAGGGRGGRAGGRGGAGAPAAPALSDICQKQATRDSIAAAAVIAAGGRGGFGGRGGRGGVNATDTTTMRWLQKEGAAAILLGDGNHVGGDIGTDNGSSRVAGAPQVAAVHVGQESYGRLSRMVEKNVAVTLELHMQNKFYPENTVSNNIVGEIPGSDPALKDEVVMIGGHFDSWHSGTGATDNGAGSGTMMEAMRLIKTLGLNPRRTIRIALWTGEEQGLYGSAAYVKQHFGSRDSTGFHPTEEQKKLAAYFNVDNGGGKIRGVYLQGMEANRLIFDAWMNPFKEMGMKTLTISNTGGTDHLSFVAAGLPGFQFIQDPLYYVNLTHHTNQDVYERLQPDDMKFNSAVVAAFAWQAAQRDEKLPRPQLPGRVQP